MKNSIMEASKVEEAIKKVPKPKENNKLYIILFGVVLVIVIISAILFYIGILPLPRKPRFILQDITFYTFTFSNPSLLTCNLQATLSARNPNTNYGMYYENLDAQALYQTQQITLATQLPVAYLAPRKITLWSAAVNGTGAPMSAYAAANLVVDLNSGNLPVRVRVEGRMKWKTASMKVGNYQLTVDCEADIDLACKNDSSYCYVESGAKYMVERPCIVQLS